MLFEFTECLNMTRRATMRRHAICPVDSNIEPKNDFHPLAKLIKFRCIGCSFCRLPDLNSWESIWRPIGSRHLQRWRLPQLLRLRRWCTHGRSLWLRHDMLTHRALWGWPLLVEALIRVLTLEMRRSVAVEAILVHHRSAAIVVTHMWRT
jgi:hypothetical protein